MINQVSLQGINDAIYLGDTRRPDYKILMYDNTDTFSDIVLGKTTQIPRDITDCVTTCSLNESDEAATTANITIIPDYTDSDPLSPYHFMGRKIIQIFYKDERENDFISLFIGPTVGQPGYRKNRATQEKVITVPCVDRSFFYNKRKLNTPDFANGTDLGDMASTIATNSSYGMDLDREEVKFGLFRHTIQHTKATIYDYTFTEGLASLGFIVDKYPAFDGDGCLVMLDTSIDKPPVRKYDDDSMLLSLEWPQDNTDIYNAVEVIGLSSSIEKVVSPLQPLATAKGTIGYFVDDFKTRIYYTKDRQGRAQNVAIGDYNINGQLGNIFDSSPKLVEVGDFSCVISIDTGYQAYLFLAWAIYYIGLVTAAGAAEADGAVWVSGILDVVAAAWLIVGLLVMQQMGIYEVTIVGEPYKLVYKEIRGYVPWANLHDYEIRTKTIENDLVDTQTLADSLAYRELKREAAKQNKRNFKLPFDPFLGKTDIIELSDGSRMYIKSISKTLKRGESSEMSVSSIMVRSGKEYNSESGYPEY